MSIPVRGAGRRGGAIGGVARVGWLALASATFVSLGSAAIVGFVRAETQDAEATVRDPEIGRASCRERVCMLV